MSSKEASAVPEKQAYRWVMLVLSWLLYFSFGLIYTTLSAVVTPVMKDLNMTYSQMGFVLGCWQLVYIFSAQPVGLLVDRIGFYKTLLLGSTIIALSSMLRIFTTSFETLAVYVALFGVGGPMISIGLPKLAATWFMREERGIASGVYVTGSIVGSITSLALTVRITMPAVGNWRNVFLAYSFVGILITVLWMFLGRRSPSSKRLTTAVQSVEEKSTESVWSLFRNRNIWLIVIIGITSFLTSHGLSNWLPKIFELKGMTGAEAGFAVSFLNLIGIGGSIFVPRLPYIVKSRKLAISIVLFVQGLAILGMGVTDGILLWASIALDGLMRGFMSLLIVTLMDFPEVGSTRMGAVGGLFFAIGEIGGFGGPFVMGLLKDVTGIFLSGILFLVAISEASIILVALLKVDTESKKD